MISMSPEPADEKEVMGKTRFVYLDENAGKTAAPYMSQPLEQGTDYIGEDEEIREEDVECLLPLEEMELLRKEQEELDSALPETEVITQAVTLEEFSLVGDVLMRVNGADQDADKRSSAARTLFAIRNTSLFDLFISQVGNEEAVNKLLHIHPRFDVSRSIIPNLPECMMTSRSGARHSRKSWPTSSSHSPPPIRISGIATSGTFPGSSVHRRSISLP